MRIFAELSQDPLLIEAYRNNESIHMQTMRILFPGQPRYLCCNKDKCTCGENNENPVYTDAKTFNFAMIYMALAKALARQTRRTVQQCEALRSSWLEAHPIGHDWMLWAGEDGLEHGWVPTLEGRRVRIPDPVEQGEHHAFTCGINYRIQGSASWPIKVAMLRQEEKGYDQRLQVHDEVISDGVYEVEETDLADFLGFQMLPSVTTPIEVKQGPIWR
jgi:DNA polymerase-1